MNLFNLMPRCLPALLPSSLSILLFAASAHAQDLTRVAAPTGRTIIISGGTVHPVSAADIPKGALVLSEGKITSVFTEGELKNFLATSRFAAPGPLTIDAAGKHVYPGLIGAYTQLGLEEMNSIRASKDTNEIGEITPETRAFIAVNPDSTLLPVTRANGVLLAGVFPAGGLITGQPALIRLHGWTVEDLAAEKTLGIGVNWPLMRPSPRLSQFRDAPREDEQARDIKKRLDLLKAFFDQATDYKRALRDGPALPTDLRLDAMRFVLEDPQVGHGEGARPEPKINFSRRPCFIQANDIDQITAAVTFCAERSLKCVIIGGRDAHLCSELLKKNDVPVILVGTHVLPKRSDSAYDDSYTLPKRLKDAGVRFCIASGQETAHERNLPYAAATAAAYGLPVDDAVKSVTLWPAQVLGVDDRFGSLEAGKSATLLITDGNPLEMTTRIEHAFIEGVEIDLRNKQTELYDKFKSRYEQRGDLKK